MRGERQAVRISSRSTFGAEIRDRQPHLERARIARELLAVVGEIDFLAVALDVLEIVGLDLERRLEPLGLAREEASALERHVEPFVRVERDRVGAFDAGECASAAL